MKNSRINQHLVMFWVIMLILNILMIKWIVPQGSKRIVDSADNPENAVLLDVHPFWFTKAEALQALQAMGEQGRQQYIRFHKREDLLFPFVYGFFLAFSIFLLNRKRLQKHKLIYLILAVPMMAMMADLVENHHIVLLTRQFPDLNSVTVIIAAIANAIKWGSVSLSLLMTAIFAVINAAGLFRRNNMRKSSKNSH